MRDIFEHNDEGIVYVKEFLELMNSKGYRAMNSYSKP